VSAKHGIIGFTKATAVETAEHGIRANAICPGFVHTPLVQKQIEDRAREAGIPPTKATRDIILAPQPTKEFVTVEQIAATALFLAGAGGDQIPAHRSPWMAAGLHVAMPADAARRRRCSGTRRQPQAKGRRRGAGRCAGARGVAGQGARGEARPCECAVVLVTGFEPFGGERTNPSWDVCARLPTEIAGLRVETARVPCEFRRSIEVLAEAIERHQPSL
jgi:hypothetical protein